MNINVGGVVAGKTWMAVIDPLAEMRREEASNKPNPQYRPQSKK